jgi:hypothetical protein
LSADAGTSYGLLCDFVVIDELSNCTIATDAARFFFPANADEERMPP